MAMLRSQVQYTISNDFKIQQTDIAPKTIVLMYKKREYMAFKTIALANND